MHGNDGSYIPDAGQTIFAINQMIHTNYTGKLSIAEDIYDSYNYDSTWDTTYPSVVTPVLTNTVDADRNMATLAGALQYDQRFGGPASSNRVAFLESHDVVGDLNDGVRLVTAIDPVTPNSYRARKLSLVGAALTFTEPGVPMIFQGQEMLENQQFSTSRPVDWTKTNTYSAIVRCYRDMIGLRRNFDGGVVGLQGDQFSLLLEDSSKKLLAFRRWFSSSPTQDVVVVANLAGTAFTNYALSMPRAGLWYVHFNSDSTNYSSDFSNIGTNVVATAAGSPIAAFTIGPYSVLVLSQTPLVPALTFVFNGGPESVSWPANYGAWTLQTTTNLFGGVSDWTTVPPSQYQTNAGAISLPVGPAGPAAFFRLHKD
jgi:1,4-alpha-glucan branching enzyme